MNEADKRELLLNRLLGCLIGGAIGDCLGGPYENTITVSSVGDYPFWLSDDTQLTLATCESIIRSKRVDPEHIAKTMASWLNSGRIQGIGGATLKALAEINAGGHWALVGRKGEYAAGNGAAIRIAPLAYMVADLTDSYRLLIADTCRITHHNDEAYSGALAVVQSIKLVLDRQRLDIGEVKAILPDCRVRDRLVSIQQHLMKHPAEPLSRVSKIFGNTGHVVDSVPLAIAAAARMIEYNDFRGPLVDVIEGGGDTDSIASMAGQVAGTYFGYTKLPREWVAKVPNLQAILTTGRRMIKLLN